MECIIPVQEKTSVCLQEGKRGINARRMAGWQTEIGSSGAGTAPCAGIWLSAMRISSVLQKRDAGIARCLYSAGGRISIGAYTSCAIRKSFSAADN